MVFFNLLNKIVFLLSLFFMLFSVAYQAEKPCPLSTQLPRSKLDYSRNPAIKKSSKRAYVTGEEINENLFVTCCY